MSLVPGILHVLGGPFRTGSILSLSLSALHLQTIRGPGEPAADVRRRGEGGRHPQRPGPVRAELGRPVLHLELLYLGHPEAPHGVP